MQLSCKPNRFFLSAQNYYNNKLKHHYGITKPKIHVTYDTFRNDSRELTPTSESFPFFDLISTISS